MMRILIVGAVALLGVAVAYDSGDAGGKDPLPIKAIMAKAHKGKESLLSKVIGGTASEEEKKTLVALYTDLGKNKPPKGDETAWKEKTAALLAAAKGTDTKALQKASNCKACHSEFK